MKVLLLSLFALVAIVMTRRPDPVLAPYPQVFTALYNESDAALPYQPARMTKVYLDVPNKRARIGFDRSDEGRTDWMLIYRPSGGDPTSPPSQNYTLFSINPDYPPFVPDNCFYVQSSSAAASSPFPDSWVQHTPEGYFVAVDSWYELPTDLVYAGPYFIEELGVMSDRWDSVRICNLQKSGIGQVPCRSVMYTQGTNPLPLMDIRAFGARKFSFDDDSYKTRVYHTFVPSVRGSDFNLPKNWESKCGNADDSFTLSPSNAASIYKNASTNVVTVQLASQPVRALGDVTVQLVLQPTWYYHCQDCIALKAYSLTFTADNWNVPQVIPMKYLKDGCTRFLMQAIGGGYEWLYFGDYYYYVITCEGNVANGCAVFPSCGKAMIK